jgi:ESF2/ABP1 family protein
MVDARFAVLPEELEIVPSKPAAAATNKKGKERQQDVNEPKKTTKKSKKRAAPASDDDDSEADLYDEVLNGPLPSTSQALDSKTAGENEEADDNDDEEHENGPLNLLPKVLQVDNVNEFNKKVDMTGLVYLSRIPPGMGPAKVKHILSNYGETGRIYLVAAEDDKKVHHPTKRINKNGKEHHKHRPHRFIEGWIEFMDKKVARSTAEMLNARPIGDFAMSRGSKKNGGTKKWKDDVWTMKYLPRFKWNMLSEQVGEWLFSLTLSQGIY